MPSSPNYQRDLKQEARTALARGERPKHNARLKARRDAMKLGMVKRFDGKDLDHTKPLSKGGSNKQSNWRVRSAGANRSFPRKPNGAMR